MALWPQSLVGIAVTTFNSIPSERKKEKSEVASNFVPSLIAQMHKFVLSRWRADSSNLTFNDMTIGVNSRVVVNDTIYNVLTITYSLVVFKQN